MDQFLRKSGCPGPGMAAVPSCHAGGARKERRTLLWDTHPRRSRTALGRCRSGPAALPRGPAPPAARPCGPGGVRGAGRAGRGGRSPRLSRGLLGEGRAGRSRSPAPRPAGAMGSHRSESDWQGLLSEVRPQGGAAGRGAGQRGGAAGGPGCSPRLEEMPGTGAQPPAGDPAEVGAAAGSGRGAPSCAGHGCALWPRLAPALPCSGCRRGPALLRGSPRRACEPLRVLTALGLRRAASGRCCCGWFGTPRIP